MESEKEPPVKKTETKGERGKRGIQGVQGVQGLPGPPGEPPAVSEGIQGVQGTQGVQGIQGEEGKRGASAKADDIPRWLFALLKYLIPAYVILALAVMGAFYVGFRFADKERERICEAVNEVALIQVNALVGAVESSRPDPPLTEEQKTVRQLAIDKYRDDVNEGLASCHN